MIYHDIERIVNDIIVKANIIKGPVNVETICQNFDILLESIEAEDSLSGFFLINDEKKKVIGYNSKHSSNRNRFTIAHELGHYQLHYKSNQTIFIDNSTKFFRNDVSSSGMLKQEREANAFAAALLMPINLVENELKKINHNKSTPEIVSKMARIFEVSEESMKFRLINLGVFSPN